MLHAQGHLCAERHLTPERCQHRLCSLLRVPSPTAFPKPHYHLMFGSEGLRLQRLIFALGDPQELLQVPLGDRQQNSEAACPQAASPIGLCSACMWQAHGSSSPEPQSPPCLSSWSQPCRASPCLTSGPQLAKIRASRPHVSKSYFMPQTHFSSMNSRPPHSSSQHSQPFCSTESHSLTYSAESWTSTRNQKGVEEDEVTSRSCRRPPLPLRLLCTLATGVNSAWSPYTLLVLRCQPGPCHTCRPHAHCPSLLLLTTGTAGRTLTKSTYSRTM